MKLLLILAAGATLIAAGSFQASASSGSPGAGHTIALTSGTRFQAGSFPRAGFLHGNRAVLAGVQLSRGFVRPQQTTSDTPTATPQPTGTTTPVTPTPTATTTYPDPTQILSDAQAAYGTIRTAHIQLITTAEKPKVEKLTITGTGDATCKGPAFKLNVKATDVLESANSKSSIKVNFVQVKNTTEAKEISKKSAKWQKIKNPNNTKYFGNLYSVENPLACPTSGSTGGGSGGQGFVPGPPVNLGPDTFQGIAVWHIQQPITVQLDSQGDTATLQLDYFIGQDHPVPYVLVQTQNDTADDVVFVEKQVTTKVGEKVKTIKLPKLGT